MIPQAQVLVKNWAFLHAEVEYALLLVVPCIACLHFLCVALTRAACVCGALQVAVALHEALRLL